MPDVESLAALSVSTEDLSGRLRESGLRVTRPRLLVLEMLGRTRNHLSVDQLVDELRECGTPLPRGSVYGIVEALVERGLLAQAELGPGPARYELDRGEDHCHFICSACGHAQDIPLQLPNEIELAVSGRIDSVQLVLRGLCANCL
jgi:Fe2+ or Zn2+ uptake regulation protein